MTAQPKPTAADVLAQHPYRPRMRDCGNSRCIARRGAVLVAVENHAQHQADMLAAAGLLATAEHDAQVAAEALRDAADGWAAHVDALGMGTTRPITWLRARADRIAGGERT